MRECGSSREAQQSMEQEEETSCRSINILTSFEFMATAVRAHAIMNDMNHDPCSGCKHSSHA